MKLLLPNDWQGVTLREYQAYIALMKEAGEKLEITTDAKITNFESECAMISLFSGGDMDEILQLDMNSHNRAYNQLGFLSQPIFGKVSTKVKVNGNRYYFEKNPRKINGGQYIALNHFLTDTDKIDANLHNLLACFAYERKWFKRTYNADKHEDVAKDLLDLPMTTVKPLTDFFLSNYQNYIKNMSLFLGVVEKGLIRQVDKLKRSYPNTDG